jgi:hypothetical protein
MPTDLVRPTITYFAERGVRDGSSPIERFGVDASDATRKFFVPWDERFLAASAILGRSEIEYYVDGGGNSTPTGLKRLVPLRHPDTVVYPFYLWASHITEVKGHQFAGNRVGGDSSIANTFTKAEITVQYESVDYQMFNDSQVTNPATGEAWVWPDDEWVRYTSIGEMTTSTEYITLPGGTIQYCRSTGTAEPHGRPIPFGTGIVKPIMEFKVTWKHIPFAIVSPYGDEFFCPWKRRIWGDGDTIKPYIGSVNKTDFMGYKAGTLLFSNIRLIPKKSPYLVPEWDIEFTFAVDPYKWNYKLFVPTTSVGDNLEWLLAIRPTSGTTTHYAEGSIPDSKCIYNEREFTNLFRVDIV